MMTKAASTSPKKPRPIPGRIAAILNVITTLVTHARYFTATAHIHARNLEFATAAAVFGTYHLPTILHRVQRGILRALALQQYLLERGARGRDLRFAWPTSAEQYHLKNLPKPERAKRTAPLPPRRRDPAELDASDPGASYIPTPEELAREVRQRSIGRTLCLICMDIGLVPGLCEGAFWMKVYYALRNYGGYFGSIYRVRGMREKTFERERYRRPETWDTNWRDFNDPAVRRAIGCKIGEPPPVPVPS